MLLYFGVVMCLRVTLTLEAFINTTSVVLCHRHEKMGLWSGS